MSLASRWAAWLQRTGGVVGVTASGPLAQVTFPATPLRCLVEIAPGADLTADPSTWSWMDITHWVRHDLGISTRVGRPDQAGQVDASSATLKLDNTDGRFSRRNPTGPYYGRLTLNTPIRMAVDPGSGMAYRYHGYVNSWPKRWDRSGTDSTVTITCGGSLRRLGRGQSLRSPMYRTIIAEDPVHYYAIEDPAGTTAALSSLPNSRDRSLRLFGGSIGWRTVDSPPGGSGASMCARINDGTLRIDPATAAPWAFEFGVLRPTNGSADSVGICSLNYFVDGVLSGTTVSILEDTDVTARDWYHYLVTGSQDGANYQIRLWRNGLERTGITAAGTLGALDRVQFNSAPALLTAAGDVAVTQFAIYDNVSIDPVVHSDALQAYAGEQAHVRIARLCAEEGVPFHGVAASSPTLGPQSTGKLLNALREAEKAGMGVLYEHEFGLGYKAINEYYNQSVLMALDFDRRHVGDPPEPADDDLRLRNQWAIARANGSTSTVQDTDFDETQGLYDGYDTVNVQEDAQLDDQAGWRVHRDTVDEDYWTGILLRFHSTPDVITGWTTLPFGSRVTISNPPPQCEPGDIDVVVEGWAERWDTVSWEATLNTSPASTYSVGVYGDAVKRYGSAYTTLAEDLDTTETGVDVTVAAGKVGWVTTASHPAVFPFDVVIGGEQMTVAGIVDNGGNSYTFTVTRSVNTVVKTHSSGDGVRLWTPAVYAL